MPNWCFNRLEITGDEKQIKKFKTKAKAKETENSKATDLSLHNFVPLPKEEEQNWYDWQIKNWGTKWDIQTDLQDEDDDRLYYEFDSAWSPPVAWLEKVAKQYPKLYFRLKYEEEGIGFMGIARGTEGEIIDNCINT